MTKRLFLVCPDCFMEQKVRAQYGSDSYFLTALGAVFHMDNFQYAEEVNAFLSGEDVKDIFIVNDVKCTFIQNTLSTKNHETKAEQKLAQLYLDNYDRFEELSSDEEKKEKLALLNIKRQAKDLLEVAFIGTKIRDHQLTVKGLLYNRKTDTFKEVSL